VTDQKYNFNNHFNVIYVYKLFILLKYNLVNYRVSKVLFWNITGCCCPSLASWSRTSSIRWAYPLASGGRIGILQVSLCTPSLESRKS